MMRNTEMDIGIENKFQNLCEILRKYSKLLIAFSGGLDSSFLLKVALDVLGKRNVLAVTAFSDSVSLEELKDSIRTAQYLNGLHRIILTEEFLNPSYLQNSSRRCFFCKDELFSKLESIAADEGFLHIVYGAITDDEGDFRPGMVAAKEHDIKSPLLEARLSKQEIRVLSHGMPFSEKVASPCLSSRVQFGESITPEKLKRIESAEAYLKELGFKLVRVRHHNHLARIEVPEEDIPKIMNEALREKINLRLKQMGYRFVSLDLEGYRQGSFNPKPTVIVALEKA